jgi:hypothetical protein
MKIKPNEISATDVTIIQKLQKEVSKFDSTVHIWKFVDSILERNIEYEEKRNGNKRCSSKTLDFKRGK